MTQTDMVDAFSDLIQEFQEIQPDAAIYEALMTAAQYTKIAVDEPTEDEIADEQLEETEDVIQS